MHIYIGADHKGFELKEEIKAYLIERGHTIDDYGNDVVDASDDYPDFAFPVAEKVATNNGIGILLCHNGVGMNIAANKVSGVRAVMTDSVTIVREARNDDHVNILCLPAQHIDFAVAKDVIDTFLQTPYGEAKRYQRRIDKIQAYEQK
ncbi:MAG: RpiB/LacA/LacB family sugar-phosphate isomerase [Patescibacteria group bacterium]